MHILLTVIFVIAWILLICYMAGLALFLLGVGMWLETGELIWLIPGIIGAYLMTKSN